MSDSAANTNNSTDTTTSGIIAKAQQLLGRSDSTTEVDIDTVAMALSCWRRRETVRIMAGLEVGQCLDIGELAERLGSTKHDCTRDQLESQERKREYVSLYQSHVPKLVDEGVLAYPEDRENIVGPTEKTAAVHEALEAVEELTEGEH